MLMVLQEGVSWVACHWAVHATCGIQSAQSNLILGSTATGKGVFHGGEKDLAALLPNIAAQARGVLGSLRLASIQLAPAEAREKDPRTGPEGCLAGSELLPAAEAGQQPLSRCLHDRGASSLRLRDQIWSVW